MLRSFLSKIALLEKSASSSLSSSLGHASKLGATFRRRNGTIPEQVEDFYMQSASKLNWGDLAGKTVMDVGCGPGNCSTIALVRMFPEITKLVAIDEHPQMLAMAQEQHSHPKIEFHRARIHLRQTLTMWEDQMEVIVSHYCLNCLNTVRAQEQALENMYRILKSGGTAALLFTLSANFFDWSKDMGEMYSQYTAGFEKEPPESHSKNLYTRDYSRALENIGFQVVDCTDGNFYVNFPSDEKCQRHLSLMCPITGNVPQEHRNEFIQNLFQHFVRLNPRNEAGQVFLKIRPGMILLRKP